MNYVVYAEDLVIDLLDILTPETVILDVEATDKDGLFAELVAKGVALGFFEDKDTFYRLLQEREQLGTTGIGKNIAVPHVRTELVDDLHMVLARSRQGIEYDSVDGNPVNFFFLVVAPPEKNELYLKMMARISRLMRADDVRADMLEADCVEDLFRVIDSHSVPV